MSDAITSTETPLWRFSLNFYRQPGVSDAAIALQDTHGVDVNLLLFLFWLASDDRQLSADDVRMIDDNVRAWRLLTVIPIRDARRKLKGVPTLVAPDQQEAFRAKVKALELDAERLQQEALYDFSRSGPLGAAASRSAAARGNVAAYEHVMGRSFPKSAVDTLLNAFDGM